MRKTWMLLALAVALVLAACADDADDVTVGEAPAEPAQETPAEVEEEVAAAEASVMVADTELGAALVDADGMSLYLFTRDEQGESTCYDGCADNWPPLVVDGEPVAGEGVDEALLGTTERDDGGSQVTYNDWPLYYFAGDDAAGDVAGQGVNDVWWLVDPDGEAIEGGGDDTAAAATDDGY